MAILARSNRLLTELFKSKKKGSMKFSHYLDSKLVTFLNSDSRDEAIDSLIHLLDVSGKLPDKALFRKAIFHREDLVSTGIGMGVAIPHAKLKDLNDFFIAMGIQQKKGLEWNALDKAPVRLVFMIGGPDNRQTEYLQILSQLTSAIREVDLRKSLLQTESRTEVLDLFSSFYAKSLS